MSCKVIDYEYQLEKQNFFQIEMDVRNYECDYQGIVNNAVYHNYFEHARHKFLIERGIDFNELIKKKIFLVAVRSELDYLISLKPKDSFIVNVKYKNITKLKGIFEQEIIILNNNKKAAKCQITIAAVNEYNKPILLKSIGLGHAIN